MDWPAIVLLAAYCVLVVLASLAGGLLPQLLHLNHTRMQLMMSFVGGLMLGVSLLHLIPHAANEMHSIDLAVFWCVVGLLFMFFLIRACHVHHHLDAETSHAEHSGDAADHDHDHDHDHIADSHSPIAGSMNPLEFVDEVSHCDTHQHRLSWIGLAFGMGLHSLIDGIALSSSVWVESGGMTSWRIVAVGAFVAILLHKPLDSLSIISVMAAGGWSRGWTGAVNLLFALTCPLGAVLFFLGAQSLPQYQTFLVGGALAFSAGVFLCISLADLLPEVRFHTHDRLKLSSMLLAGVGCAMAIGYFEPPHAHYGQPSSTPHAEHSHDEHLHDEQSHDEHSHDGPAGDSKSPPGR